MADLEYTVEARTLPGILEDVERLVEIARRGITLDVDLGDGGREAERLSAGIDDAADEARRLSREQRQANTQLRQGTREVQNTNNQLRNVVRTVAALGIGRAVGGFLGDVVRESNAANESINAVAVTFGDATDRVEEFVQTSSTIGLAAAEAREGAVAFGSLFNAAGLGVEQGAELTEFLTSLSADLASVYNRDVPEAQIALAGLFRGETEPARRFGLSINAAAIEAEALASGLAASKSEIDPTAKALATFALVQQQTQNVSGDFERTVAESLPNALRVLRAELINTQAEIGTSLQEPLLQVVNEARAQLPELQELFVGLDLGEAAGEILPGLVEFLGELVQLLPDVVGLATDFVQVGGGVLGIISDLNGITGGAALQVGALALSARSLFNAFGGGGAGEGAAAIFLAADAIRRLGSDSATTSDQLVGLGEAAVAGFLAFGPAGAAAGLALGVVAGAIGEIRAENRRAEERQIAFTEAVNQASGPVSDLSFQIETLRDAYEALPDATGEAAESIQAQTGPVVASILELGGSALEEFAKFRAAGADVEVLERALISGTDIFEEAQELLRAGMGADGTIDRLQKLAEESDNVDIQRLVDELASYQAEAELGTSSLIQLLDAFDESADSADDHREAIEEAAKAAVEEQVALGELNPAVLATALAFEAAGDSLTPFADALRQSTAEALLAEQNLAALERQQNAYNRTVAEPREDQLANLAADDVARLIEYSAGVAELRAEFDGLRAGDADAGLGILSSLGADGAELFAQLDATGLGFEQAAELARVYGLSLEDLNNVQAVAVQNAEAQRGALDAQIDSFTSRIPGLAAALDGLEENDGLANFLDAAQQELTEFLGFQANINGLIEAGADDLVRIIQELPVDQAAAFAAEAAATLSPTGIATAATAAFEQQAEQVRLGYAEARAAAEKGAVELGLAVEDGLVTLEERLSRPIRINPQIEFIAEEFGPEALADAGALGAIDDLVASVDLMVDVDQANYDGFLATVEEADPELLVEVNTEAFEAFEAVVEETELAIPVTLDLSQARAQANSFAFDLGGLGFTPPIFNARHGLITNSPTLVRTSEHDHREVFIPIIPTEAGRKEAHALAERSGLLDLIDPLIDRPVAAGAVLATRGGGDTIENLVLQVSQQMPATTNPEAAMTTFQSRAAEAIAKALAKR